MSRIAVVTGGTAGIGLHTAVGLAESGVTVFVTGRDLNRGRRAETYIRRLSGRNDATFVQADVSDLSGVQSLASKLLDRLNRLDILVNNAGHLGRDRYVNSDGFELDFAVNVVAPFRLTMDLLPLLEISAPSRVLMITGGKSGDTLYLNDLQAEERFSPIASYSNTKRAADAMSLLMASELAPKGVYLNIVYPGIAITPMTMGLASKIVPGVLRPLFNVLGAAVTRLERDRSARKAARSSVYVALSPDYSMVSGVYVGSNSMPADLHRTVRDPANQQFVMDVLRRAGHAAGRLDSDS